MKRLIFGTKGCQWFERLAVAIQTVLILCISAACWAVQREDDAPPEAAPDSP